MKNPKLAFISLILATILLFPSCKDPAADTLPPETTPAETTEEIKSELIILDDGKNDYKIIRPEKAEEYEISAAVNLNGTLMNKFDDIWDRKLTDDFVKGKKGEIIENNEKEILIGYTNRKESRDIFETLKEDEYVICTVNEKIVIIGENQYATHAAVEAFISEYVTNLAEKSLSVPANLNIKGVCELRKIPLYADSSYRIMSYNLGCAVGVADDAAQILLNYLADIICLQETDKETHLNVVSKLPDYFEAANEFHSNGKTYNYTPIIYNTKLFTLKDSGLEWLDGRYTGTNTKSIAWAVLETKDGQKLAIINFHGAVCSEKYKGFENMTKEERDKQALEWRIDNVRQILEIRTEIEKKHGVLPLMVTGDCNFNSTSEPYAKLINAGFEDAEITASNKTTGYKTSYSYGSITTAQSGKSIDHIFKINGIEFIRFNSVRDPIVFTASDHLPVYTDFNIAK